MVYKKGTKGKKEKRQIKRFTGRESEELTNRFDNRFQAGIRHFTVLVKHLRRGFMHRREIYFVKRRPFRKRNRYREEQTDLLEKTAIRCADFVNLLV